jgi:hypothetical protein
MQPRSPAFDIDFLMLLRHAPQLSPRIGVRVIRMRYARIFAVLLALAATAAHAQQRPNRRAVLTKLADDTDAGMAGASKLSEKDRKELAYSRDLVREMAGVQGNLVQADRDDLRKAFKNINKRSKSFDPDRRRTIQEDIRAAQRLGLDRQQRTRARAPRPMRIPTGPRIRRWP